MLHLQIINCTQQCIKKITEGFLAIVCFDGGIFVPTEEEKLRDWNKIKEVSFSPVLRKVELQGPIFENKTEIESVTDFVNYGMLTLKNKNF